jgi:hypothetical protein
LESRPTDGLQIFVRFNIKNKKMLSNITKICKPSVGLLSNVILAPTMKAYKGD